MRRKARSKSRAASFHSLAKWTPQLSLSARKGARCTMLMGTSTLIITPPLPRIFSVTIIRASMRRCGGRSTRTTLREIRLAELLHQAVSSLDLVQIVNTGSDATAHALRLSYAFTGREDIILMLGDYDGWHDELARAVMPSLDALGSPVSPGEYPFLPLTAGFPSSTPRRVHIVNLKDLDSLEYMMRWHRIACVITAPVLQNIGVVPPKPGYLNETKK